MDKSMIGKAEIARKRGGRRRAAQALGLRSALELRAAARSRLRATAVRPDVTAASLIARATELRKQLRKG